MRLKKTSNPEYNLGYKKKNTKYQNKQILLEKKKKLKSETNVPKFVPTSCLCLFLEANGLA
jgi:hypothetical protein